MQFFLSILILTVILFCNFCCNVIYIDSIFIIAWFCFKKTKQKQNTHTHTTTTTTEVPLQYTENCNFDFKTSWQTTGSVLVNTVTLELQGVSNESERNFLNGDTSHVTPNPIAVTNKVIEVVPSYFVELFIIYI